MENLFRHIENMQNKFGIKTIVAINMFNTDKKEELEFIENALSKKDIQSSRVDSWKRGSDGAIDIAEKIVINSQEENKINYIYDEEDPIKTKIEKIAKNIYGAEGVVYSENAIKDIEIIEKNGKTELPICIAKTQYSFSDDPKNIMSNNSYKIHVQNIILKNGAEFIVVIAGNIMTMPGLPKIPAAEEIDLDENNEIIGIF